MLLKKKETDLSTAPGTSSATLKPTKSPRTKKSNKTSVTIHYDVGFGNALYLRGRGANLSWDKGVMLRNINNNEWVWETDTTFNNCEFKALINDNEYECGENHLIKSGEIIQYTPEFNH